MEFKDLSPELQAKVQACETPEELLALAKEEGRELTEEELQMVAGGGKNIWGLDSKCPYCGSDDTTNTGNGMHCNACGKDYSGPFG